MNILNKIKNRFENTLHVVQIAVDSSVIGMKLRMAAHEADAGEPTWTTWTTGGRIRIKAMSNSHLFYAIGKAFRGEYPGSRARRTGVEALKREALRRLAHQVAGVQL